MIASVSALEWENPDSDTEYIPGDYTLNVSGDSANASNSVDFYYDEGDGWEEISTGVTGSTEGDFWTVEGVDGNLGTVEDLGLKANFSTSPDYGDTTTVTLDKGGPDSFQLIEPDEFTSDENPNVEVEVTDDYSGVQNISVNVEDSNNDQVDSTECDSTTTCELDVSDLSNGETYDVEISSYDKVGNQNSDSLSFTVDTEYDGDSNPEFWVEKEGDEVEDDYFDFEDDVELVADFGDADSESDTTVSCMIEGEEIDTFTVDAGDDDPSESSTTCDIDYDEDEPYYDTNAEIYLEMEDQAGNSDESDTQELGFDAGAPSFSEFEASSGIAVFNSDFEMSYEAFDSVSGIDYIDYSIGDGDEVQLDQSSGSFTADTSGLEQGTFEVQAQAVDNVGKVSDERTFEFDFYPDEVPEMNLDGETELNVTSGSEETLELELSNTGRLLVPGGEVTGSVDFVESASYGDLAPSETNTLEIVFSPENGIGDYNVNLEASSVEASHQVEVLVRANEEKQSEIDSSVSEYRSQFDDLNSRAESLRPSLNQDRTSRLNEDYEAFESQLNEAEQAIEEGRYYDADEVLSDLDSSSQTAESTFETVKSEHETAQRNRYIIAGMFFVLLLIGGGAGFILYSEDYEVDIDSLKDMDIGSSSEESSESDDDGYSHSESEKEEKSALDRVRDRVDNLRGSGEEEPEYEFK